MPKKMKSNYDIVHPGFINFLKNEFLLVVSDAKAGKALDKAKIKSSVKNIKTASSSRDSFHKIGKLVDDALRHLPDVADENSDFDDKQSSLWRKLQSQAKVELNKHAKHSRNALPAFTAFSVKNQRDYDSKTLVLALVLVAIILINSFFTLKPELLHKAFSSGSFLISREHHKRQSGSSAPAQSADVVAPGSLDMAAAKALYILRHQKEIRNQKTVGISAKELFGERAGASDLDEAEDKNIAVGEKEKNHKIEKIVNQAKTSWLNFFKEIYGK